MLDVEIISDDKNIIVSENFITFNDQPIELKFELNRENLAMRLVFEVDEKNDESGIKIDVEGKILIVRLKNFDAVLGKGNIEPVEIGQTRGKKLFTNFWIVKPSVMSTA